MTKPASPAGGIVFDLVSADREMRQEDGYMRQGHIARTLTRERDLRIVLVVMTGGSRIAEHHANETACIHALSGHLRMHILNRVVELTTGQLLVVERGLGHDVSALVESSFLLTLGWPQSS